MNNNRSSEHVEAPRHEIDRNGDGRQCDEALIVGRAQMIRQAHFGQVIILQGITVFVLSLSLDGGMLLKTLLIALAAYWGAVLVYLIRQSVFPGNRLPLVRHGWILVYCLTAIMIGFARLTL